MESESTSSSNDDPEHMVSEIIESNINDLSFLSERNLSGISSNISYHSIEATYSQEETDMVTSLIISTDVFSQSATQVPQPLPTLDISAENNPQKRPSSSSPPGEVPIKKSCPMEDAESRPTTSQDPHLSTDIPSAMNLDQNIPTCQSSQDPHLLTDIFSGMNQDQNILIDQPSTTSQDPHLSTDISSAMNPDQNIPTCQSSQDPHLLTDASSGMNQDQISPINQPSTSTSQDPKQLINGSSGSNQDCTVSSDQPSTSQGSYLLSEKSGGNQDQITSFEKPNQDSQSVSGRSSGANQDRPTSSDKPSTSQDSYLLSDRSSGMNQDKVVSSDQPSTSQDSHPLSDASSGKIQNLLTNMDQPSSSHEQTISSSQPSTSQDSHRSSGDQKTLSDQARKQPGTSQDHQTFESYLEMTKDLTIFSIYVDLSVLQRPYKSRSEILNVLVYGPLVWTNRLIKTFAQGLPLKFLSPFTLVLQRNITRCGVLFTVSIWQVDDLNESMAFLASSCVSAKTTTMFVFTVIEESFVELFEKIRRACGQEAAITLVACKTNQGRGRSHVSKRVLYRIRKKNFIFKAKHDLAALMECDVDSIEDVNAVFSTAMDVARLSTL